MRGKRPNRDKQTYNPKFPAPLRRKRFSALQALLPFAWVGIFTALALLPLPAIDLGPFDKILHVGVTFGAMVLFFYGSGKKSIAFLAYLGIILLLYSFAIEVIQGYIPGRTFNPYDILANTTGIILAFFFLRKGVLRHTKTYKQLP